MTFLVSGFNQPTTKQEGTIKKDTFPGSKHYNSRIQNCHLYLSKRCEPLSIHSHPPSCFEGLITGEFQRFWLQNNPTLVQVILTKFIHRLTEKGHNINTLALRLIKVNEET
jgi:hypothetical protein